MKKLLGALSVLVFISILPTLASKVQALSATCDKPNMDGSTITGRCYAMAAKFCEYSEATIDERIQMDQKLIDEYGSVEAAIFKKIILDIEPDHPLRSKSLNEITNEDLWLSENGEKKKISIDLLREKCVVSFGKPWDVPGNISATLHYRDGSPSEKVWKYNGYSANGNPILNVEYPEWHSRKNTMVYSGYDFYENPVSEPWGATRDLKVLGKSMDEYGAGKAEDLLSIMDKYNKNKFQGQFREKNENEDGLWIGSGNTVDLLANHATFSEKRGDWVDGQVTFYFENTSGQLGSTTFLLPMKNSLWESSAYDLSCEDITLNTLAVAGEEIDLTVAYKAIAEENGVGVSTTFNDVDFSYSFSGYEEYGGYDNSYADRITFVNYKDIPSNQGTESLLLNGTVHERSSTAETLGLDKAVYPVPDEDGKVTLTVHLNAKHNNPNEGNNGGNNICNIEIPVQDKNNVKVSIDHETDLFGTNTPLRIPVTISNDLGGTIHTECAGLTSGEVNCSSNKNNDFNANGMQNDRFNVMLFKITNIASGTMEPLEEGNSIDYEKLEKLNEGNGVVIEGKGRNKKHYYIETGIKEPGVYKLVVKIPNYTIDGSEEYDLSDNTAEFLFEVEPVPPDNVECNSILDENPSTTTDKRIVKMCVGHLPNFPSTDVEGGIGTYFWVKYFFLPNPLPDYNVAIGDKDLDGRITDYDYVYQKLSIDNKEESGKLGKEDTFLNYPVTYDAQANPARLKGPYVAGPHEFHHFMYRGRMISHKVDFNFTVFDPERYPIAKGKIVYDIFDPSEYDDANNCLNLERLDYKDRNEGLEYKQCREIIFYLPNQNVANWDEPPPDDDKIRFKNPGVHTFSLEAFEHNMYYYQHDEGNEYQGKNGVDYRGKTNVEAGAEWASDPLGYEQESNFYTNKGTSGSEGVLTDSIDESAQKYYIRNDFHNHCEIRTDEFGNGKDYRDGNATDNSPTEQAEYCFHDHSSDYHYWKYDWSEVRQYKHSFEAIWDEAERADAVISHTFTTPDTYINHGQINYFASDEITAEFWINTADNNAGILSYASSNQDNDFLVFLTDTGKMRMHNSGNGLGNVVDTSEETFNDGNWHHFAVTWKNSDGKYVMYKNGMVIDSGYMNQGYEFADSGTLYIGMDQDCIDGCTQDHQHFDGELKNVRIWNKVRTQQEIQQNANIFIPSSSHMNLLVSY